MPRSKGGRGLRSVEMEYKATKIKGAVRLHGSQYRVLGMVREFEEQAARTGRRSIFKQAVKCTVELGLELDLEHAQKIKTEEQKCQIEKLVDEIRNQRWQGRLVTTRLEDESLSANGCFCGSQSGRTAHHTQSLDSLSHTSSSYQREYTRVRRPTQARKVR